MGGAGMSPLAHVLHARGLHVSGSDGCMQKTVEALHAAGITCHIGHAADHVAQADAFVYSSAIRPENPEWARARERGIPCLHRAALLAQIVNPADGITIAGTHGKTTTAALAAVICAAAGLDPTAVIGGFVPAFNGYHRVGAGHWVVIETDESDGSFTRFQSRIAVLLNIDRDHLDYYADLEAIVTGFAAYLAGVKPGGTIVFNGDDTLASELARKAATERTVDLCECRLEAEADFSVQAIEGDAWASRFTVIERAQRYTIELGVPGRHNVGNALHAIAAARTAGADIDAVQRACRDFQGVHRRFERLGQYHGATVIDDYAHHPVEIEATLATAARLHARVVVVFQPHRFSRTEQLLDEFAAVLARVPDVFITEVFGASEDPGQVTGATLWERVRTRNPQAQYVPDLALLPALLAETVAPGDIILCLGAGTISNAAHALVDNVAAVTHERT
jgi:UDP-N-acetylmuramate--alanine ligase